MLQRLCKMLLKNFNIFETKKTMIAQSNVDIARKEHVETELRYLELQLR